MRCFKLIEQIAQLKKKIADLELSLGSQRSINSRLITENNRLTQEIASIGNPIYLSVSTFEADYPEPYSNVIRVNCDDTWKDIEMSAKAKFFDDLYKQGYIRKSDVETGTMATDTSGMPYVTVRTYSAGVHCGYLKERNGKEVELVNARRIWKWSGAFTLSELATKGVENPSECKFSCVVSTIYLTEAIEIIPMTESAMKSIQGVSDYEC